MLTAAWNPFLRFPRLALAASAVLALPLLVQLTRFGVSAETRALLAGDERNLSSYEKVQEVLAGTELILVSLERADLFTPEGIDAVRRVSDALASQPGVLDVKSLTHSFRPVRRGLTFEMVPFVPQGPFRSNDLAQLERFCLAHPLVRNLLVSADGRHTLVTVTFPRLPQSVGAQQALRRQVDAALEPFRTEGFRFTVLGLPLVEEEIRRTLKADAWRFVPAVLVLVLVILWRVFRSWRLLLLVLVNHMLLLLLLPGVLQLAGFRLNIFSVMLVPLLAGIQLTLLTHLFSAFQRGLVTGAAPEAALAEALRIVAKPAVFASLTTIVGLLSLAAGGVRPTAEFGVMSALGLCLVHGLTFGPGLALLKLAVEHGTGWRVEIVAAAQRYSDRIVEPRWPGQLMRWAQDRGGRLLLMGGALAVVTAIGVRWVRTDIRAVEFLNPKSPARQAIEHFDRVYGGINVVQIEFDTGKTNGVNDMSVLRYLDAVHREAGRRPEFTGVYSYPQLLAMMHQIWEGDRPGTLRLPDNPWLVQVFVLALRSYDFPFLSGLADAAQRTAYLVLRTRDLPADRYLELVHGVVRFAQTQCPPGVTVSAARGFHSVIEADRRILRSQLASAGLTFGVIGAMLALLWRSPGLAAAALLANALPVASVIALAGFLRLPLNSITVMVAAISLGIAVDNAIHFITHWRTELGAGASAAAATERTLRVKGRPILWAGAVLIAVFGVFWCSSFPPVVHFGLLSSAAFLGGLGGVLIFLPAVLCRWPPR